MMPKTLYHFTSPRHIHSVLDEGLTMGHIPISLDPPRLRSGYQWLTRDKSFDQAWNSMTNLDYDRTAYRLTIEIPNIAMGKLIDWTSNYEGLVEPHAWKSLNAGGHPNQWVLFKGVIRPQWFVDVTAKNDFAEIELKTHTGANA